MWWGGFHLGACRFWGCNLADSSQAELSVQITTAGGQQVVPSRDDRNWRSGATNSTSYILAGHDVFSETIVFEAPRSNLPMAPGEYRFTIDRALDALGTVCADIVRII